MRIAYLHSGGIPSVYADGIHVARMCDAFTEAGHDVVLYALPGKAEAPDVHAYYGTRHRFEVRPVPAWPVPRAGAALRARRVRAALRGSGAPDLLYGRDPRALLAAADLAPFVYETHTLPDDRPARALERRLLRHPRLTRVVCVSGALADDYRRAHPELGGTDVVTAHEGADPAPVTGSVAGLPGRPGAARVGYVGGLRPGRGIDLILELAARLPGLDFHLLGGRPEDVAVWRPRRALPNVHFHGHRTPGSLGPYYRAFDIVLAPCQGEAACAGGGARWVSPMKLFEYMAHGRAVVASDLPVLREVLTDGEDCLLCPPDDPAAWECALTALAGDPDLRRAFGDEARRRLLDRYTWRRRADLVLPPLASPAGAGAGAAGSA